VESILGILPFSSTVLRDASPYKVMIEWHPWQNLPYSHPALVDWFKNLKNISLSGVSSLLVSDYDLVRHHNEKLMTCDVSPQCTMQLRLNKLH